MTSPRLVIWVLWVLGTLTQPAPHLHESRTCYISLCLRCTLLELWPISYVISPVPDFTSLTDLYNDFTAIRNPVEGIIAALEVTYANPPRQRPLPLKTKSWQTLVVLSPSLPPC